MKKPSEYLIERVLNNWGTDLESIKESIKQAQEDAYNVAIDDAIYNINLGWTEDDLILLKFNGKIQETTKKAQEGA